MNLKLVVALVAASCAIVFAMQERDSKGVTAVKAQDVKWQKAEGMPEGVMVAPVQGDMKKEPFLALVKFPAGTRINLHWHSPNGGVAVITGALTIGTEGSPAEGKGMEVGPGGYFRVSAKAHHWTVARAETVFALFGDTGHDMNWVGGKEERK